MYFFERILSRKKKLLHLVTQVLRDQPHDAQMRSMQRDSGLVLISGKAENHSEWNLLDLAALGVEAPKSLLNSAN